MVEAYLNSGRENSLRGGNAWERKKKTVITNIIETLYANMDKDVHKVAFPCNTKNQKEKKNKKEKKKEKLIALFSNINNLYITGIIIRTITLSMNGLCTI